MNEDLVSLRFASSILARLGEELIPDPDQGLLELVRNAYDAGATSCSIDVEDAARAGGSLTIEDDGLGMTVADLTDGFFVLGRSRKARHANGRLLVGEKGLGRLAALRLGRVVTIETWPHSEGLKHSLSVDWDRYIDANVVEDVHFSIVTSPAERGQGTKITISELRESLTPKRQDSLARSLLLLSDPFGTDSGFEAKLTSSSFADLAKIIRGQYLGAADYRLTARLDGQGYASAELRDHTDNIVATASHTDFRQGRQPDIAALPYHAPAAEFELYVFLLGGKSQSGNLQLRKVGIGKVSEWLKNVGGVHLYHRGLRVRPFGDPGYDWLRLNLRRASSPEDRPSTNTLIGRVLVGDDDDLLITKTDRVGFVENEAFQELRDFAVDATEFMAAWRIARSKVIREERRLSERTDVDEASDQLTQAVGKLPSAERAPVEAAVRTYKEATRRRDEGRVADVQLYRTMSTLGAATSVFAHETDKPTERLLSLLKLVRRRVDALGEKSGPILGPIDELDRVAANLRALTRMPLRLIKANRRLIAPNRIAHSVEEVLDTFDYFLQTNQVVVETQFAENDTVVAAPAALEVIVANMVINAVTAFASDKRPAHERILSISSTTVDSSVVLEVSDSGPGFQGITAERVWLIGETRREGGSGLGLSIVRDTVLDLGGSADAVSPGTMGGATFFIRLPQAAAR